MLCLCGLLPLFVSGAPNVFRTANHRRRAGSDHATRALGDGSVLINYRFRAPHWNTKRLVDGYLRRTGRTDTDPGLSPLPLPLWDVVHDFYSTGDRKYRVVRGSYRVWGCCWKHCFFVRNRVGDKTHVRFDPLFPDRDKLSDRCWEVSPLFAMVFATMFIGLVCILLISFLQVFICRASPWFNFASMMLEIIHVMVIILIYVFGLPPGCTNVLLKLYRRDSNRTTVLPLHVKVE